MTTYIVKNPTSATVQISDAGGNIVSIATSAQVSLTDAQYTSAVSIFGQANVTLVSGTTNAIANFDSQGVAQSNFPAGFQRVTVEPKQIFYDPFDAALDTTNLWVAPTTGNAAVAATVSAGVMDMETGTTASGWSKLISAASFKPPIPGWIGFSFALNLPDGAAPLANSYRFWGAGNPATTPTTAAPMTDAIGFELTTAGKLVAVVYAAGVRTQVADLSASGTNRQPLDALSHRYIVYVRTDRSYWYIDGLSNANLAATSSFQAPSVQTLPLALVAVGGSTPPTSSAKIQSSGLAVWDTAGNAAQLADGTYPWRKANISAGGGLSVFQTGSLGVDASANKPTLPNVGANFAASGPYASYFLVTTLAANPARNSVDIENTSGAQIAIIRDDGTAANASAPVNASVFALAGGTGAGSAGGSWTSRTFRGRLQVYAASAAAQVAVMAD